MRISIRCELAPPVRLRLVGCGFTCTVLLTIILVVDPVSFLDGSGSGS